MTEIDQQETTFDDLFCARQLSLLLPHYQIDSVLALQRTLFVWRRSTGAQVVEIDSELFQICCGCFGMATPGCGDACLMVLDDFDCVLQAVAACRVRQGERVDQCVRGSMDLVQRDLRIFPPAAGSPAATETSGSLE